MIRFDRIPSWISQPIFQVIFFLTSYSFFWSLIGKMGYIRRDVSWGILMEYLFIFFIALSILLGVFKYFKVLTSTKLSVLFAIIFLTGSGFFLYFSLLRLGLIWGLAILSLVTSHLLANRKIN